jgi:bifunctional non-homologous end joining protein LigD
VIHMPLPAVPMAPITSIEIPEGPEWGYQIKWDGVRTLARLDGMGGVELFSRRMEFRNSTFPEIAALLASLKVGPCVLDGEIAYFDEKRPNFQRGQLGVRNIASNDTLLFVLFDLLHDNGEDLRSLPFRERYDRLSGKFPTKHPRLFVTDLYDNGTALWAWLEERDWEGIVSKRLSSPYSEGKKHQDWFKKRKALRIVADVVGIKRKDGRVASLVLRFEDRFIGLASLGLDYKMKELLQQFARDHPGACPFPSLAPDLKKADVAWLGVPFRCRVTALEFTNSGLLRHPKLLGFGEA